jgi:hypothetical protein
VKHRRFSKNHRRTHVAPFAVKVATGTRSTGAGVADTGHDAGRGFAATPSVR